jgi:glycosyltransferase involved in cell wall biosynthesis
MKLLLYSNFFYPQTGGTQAIVLALARGFSVRHAVTVGVESIEVTVATQEREAWAYDEEQPFRIVRAPGLGDLRTLIGEADLVHIAGPALAPLLLCVLTGKKFVVEHHAFQTACPNGQYFYEQTSSLCVGHFMRGNYRQCVECDGRVVSRPRAMAEIGLSGLRRRLCNRAAANILPTQWLGSVIELNRMKTIHHGVADVPLSALHRRPEATSGAKTIFAFQGRLVPTKGIRVLLDAVKILQGEGRAFSVKFIGGGPALEYLKADEARENLNVQILGHVPDDGLPAALADVSAIVMPSIAGEVFGLVAAESMIRGRLVIVSDLGSLKEVVGDGALTFRNGDAADLADKMKFVMDNPGAVVSVSERARKRALEAFNLGTMVERHIELYRSVLGAGASNL